MDDIIKEARERYQAALDADADNRRQAEEDLKFAALEQWDEAIKRQRLIDGRPALVMDRTGQIVRQITGDARLNPPGITVRPVDSGADPDTAETFNGLIRNIESSSNAETHYISALESSARCGMGFLKVTYDYTDDSSFDMQLGVKAIRSPFAVVMDPFAEDPVRADMEYCFVSDLIPLPQYRKRFKNASLTDWDGDGSSGEGEYPVWRDGNAIRVAEYWQRTTRSRKLLLLGSGSVIDVTDMAAAEVQAQAQQFGVLRERKAEVPYVTMRLINGAEELDDPYEWPGIYIPIIPVWGEIVELGGRTVRRGVIRAARDAQIRYNAAASAVTEYTMAMNKGKRILDPSQVEGHEGDWAQAHITNRPYLLLNPSDNPNVPFGGVPMQTEPPPAGLLADVQLAAQDIEAATGVYRENLGKESNAISGRAILSRQREGDVGSFLYVDNLARAVAQVGRILVDTIPRVYDTPRVVRILGEDGKTDFAPINTWDPQTGRVINDLSQGRYDVVASTGPAFSTRREEGREFIMAAVQANPEVMQIGGDILMEMMDAPGAEEIAKRFRKRAVAMGIAEPKEGEPPAQPPPPDPNMLLAQAEMAKAQAQQMRAQADAQKSQTEAQVEMAKLQIEAARLDLERQKLGLSAVDTQSKIAERAAKVANDGAKLRLDAVDKMNAAQDRRVGMVMGEQRARRGEAQAERRDIRGHQARQQMESQRRLDS